MNEKERNKRTLRERKKGKLHEKGACGLVSIYYLYKIMQLDASKDWGEGNGRDFFAVQSFTFVFSFWGICIPEC